MNLLLLSVRERDTGKKENHIQSNFENALNENYKRISFLFTRNVNWIRMEKQRENMFIINQFSYIHFVHGKRCPFSKIEADTPFMLFPKLFDIECEISQKYHMKRSLQPIFFINAKYSI